MNVIDYILKGCALTEKLMGDFIRQDRTGRAVFSCTEGAAWVGRYGVVARPPSQTDIEGAFPEFLLKQAWQCPECGESHVILGSAVVHLNDDHDWSRESIAAWLAVQLGYATAVELPVRVEQEA